MTRMTNKRLNAMSDAERAAWIDNLDEDERRVLYVSGYRYAMVVAADLKRALVTLEMQASERLWILEGLKGLTDQYFTPGALAAIKPAGKTMAQMIAEACTLDQGEGSASGSFDVLTSWEIFWGLIKVHPSLLEAIRLCALGALKPH